jgi:hypothetical protein
MGRKKITIKPITDERNRHVTFNKRKSGLIKKAMELSILCNCQISLVIFNAENQLFEYCSTDPRYILQRYCQVAHLPHERLTNADYDKTTKGKAKTTSTSTTAPTATKSTTSTSKKKKSNNGTATSTVATAGAHIPQPKTEPQEQLPQQQYLPPQTQQLPQLQTMIPPPQPQNELLQSYPNTIETPKSLFPEMPFTPLTPNTSAVIESIMNGATNPARVSTQPQQQIPSIASQLLPPPGMNQPYMNQQNMMQPQMNNPSQSDMQFMQQQHMKQQQLQAQLMQQTIPAQPNQQQFQQYQQSGKRKSFDAGIRDDDSPSTKRRKSAGIGLSIVVPDSNQIPLRRVEQDNSQPVLPQPSDDSDLFTAPQPVDKNKQSGNSSENLTPMNSGVFSPTDEKSPMPLHLSTPTSLSAMEWPSPTSAFCSLSKNKKDIISS